MRVTSEHLEQILDKEIKVLDHGAIRVLEYFGDDQTIVNAARISYGEGTKKTRNNKNLIDYLLRNKHTSPFEMCEILLYIKLPIFVAAQWIRHRTANVNAYSARYSVMTDEFYVPGTDNVKGQDSVNRQASGEKLDEKTALEIIDDIEKHNKSSYDLYENLLEKGLSREQARIILPQNLYTSWYWKIDLHNLIHFLALRTTDHAQYEIREYARVILFDIVAKWVPNTFEAFCRHKLGAISISTLGQKVIRDARNNQLKTREEYIDENDVCIGKGEWAEIMHILDIKE